MANTVTVKITGLKELQDRLDALAPKLARGIFRTALLAGAHVLQAEMQARARRLTGFLIQHIGLRVSAVSGALAGYAVTGPLKEDYPRRIPKRGGKGRTISVAAVARYLEFGTRKMAAKPFIRPAFEAKSHAALDAFIAKAREAFNQAVR